MAGKKEKKETAQAYIINPNNFPVTVEYDGKSIVLSPKQKVRVEDQSKIGKYTSKIFIVKA
jgi:ethanolamine utilization protein EutQ (cupin superfamily)